MFGTWFEKQDEGAGAMKIFRFGMMSFIVMVCVLGLGITSGFPAVLDNHNGTITDTETGLVWKQSTEGVKRSWNGAVQYCEDLNFAGYDDWRLPRIDELRTIVNFNRSKPATDPLFVVHADPKYSFTWSSSIYVNKPWGAWFIDFYDGMVDAWSMTDVYYVRCVRGGPFWSVDPSEHLHAVSANTVWDSETSLAWQRKTDGVLRTWQDAKSYCDELDLDGTTDWRLPSIEESQTVIDYTKYNPSLNNELFGGKPGAYWSSSNYVADTGAAWLVDLVDGALFADYYKDSLTYYVRCVRTAPDMLGKLKVDKSGPGTGEVTSIPAGIDCGPTCSVSFSPGTKVTLKAVAGAGSDFAGWLGGGCTGTGECEVAIEPGESTEITAFFVPRYVVDAQGEMVTDKKTKLIWQKADSKALMNWAVANDYCSNLTVGGLSWRLPRIDELLTIVDYSRYQPAINPVFDGAHDRYWSNTADIYGEQLAVVPGDPQVVWSVDFSEGSSSGGNPSADIYYVRCVSGGPFWSLDPSNRLEDDGGNTVEDSYWGYMWEKFNGAGDVTWVEAKAHCEALELDGFTDWRVPGIQELQTVIDYTSLDPVFEGGANPYWSSTIFANSRDQAWQVSFDTGITMHVSKLGTPYVRCVRGGKEAFAPLTVEKVGTGTGKVKSDPQGINCGPNCSAYFETGAEVTLTAEADASSTFTGWSGGGDRCTGSGDCIVVVGETATVATGSNGFLNTQTGQQKVTAEFAIKTFTITASSSGNGSISPAGEVKVNYGLDKSFTITPAPNHHVVDVLVDGKSVGAVTKYTFKKVTDNHSIDATFAIDTYTIEASAGANGSISPSGAVKVEHGSDQTFTISPSTYYHVADVKVDGKSVGAVTSYTFKNVMANHTIAATFEASNLIFVDVPGGGEVWDAGSKQPIKWHYIGNPGTRVRIELLIGATVVKTISPSASIGSGGNGYYDWTIPATQAAGKDYKVRVTSLTAPSATHTSETFEIKAPTITVVSPPNGEPWYAGAKQRISWTYTGNPGTRVKIELLNGDAVVKTISTTASIGSGNSGYYDWTIPATQAGGSQYKIRVKSTTIPACTDTSDTFTIKGPTITIVSPNGGEEWVVGAKQTISWTYEGNPGSRVKIQLLNGITVVRTITTAASTGSGGSGYYDWTIPTTQAVGTAYRITVTSSTIPACTDTSNDSFIIKK
jgi:hypothetical protein